VIVHGLSILALSGADVELCVHSGKGFYVRALARDLASALGTVGHLTALRRTHSGGFSLEDAVDVTGLQADMGLAAERVRAKLLPLAAALRDCPRRVLTQAGVIEVRHGRPVRPEHWVPVPTEGELTEGQQPIALIDEEGALRALGRFEGDRIAVVRGMA
jgi:tRNA pseudouridine55 synthase